jgi:GTP-binding protein
MGLEGPANHDGGGLVIHKGQLYIGVGDTGANATPPSNKYAACLNKANGKILRVNLDGTTPADNPLATLETATGCATVNAPFTMAPPDKGVVSLDREVASRLRQSGKTVLVAANKADNVRSSENATEFSELGFDRIFPVSAIHGRGLDALMQSAMSLLPSQLPPPDLDAATPAAAAPLKLAIVGRPNVGKSSLINAITHSSRVIVSPIPGTTRDSVDVPFEVDTEGHRQSYGLIDTAGIRKSKRVRDSVEFYSVQRAESSITRCDIALLVLDAESGILEQDKKIADQITSQNKACILVVNKWDLFQSVVQAARKVQPRRFARRQDHQTDPNLDSFGRWVQESLFFLDYAPVIFTSATDGLNLDRLLESVRYVAAQLQQRIPTALLNRTIQQSVERRQPISPAGHFLNFFYATQTHSAPPTFLLFVNRDELFSVAYKKYLSGELRKAFGYEGCPIVLIPKARPKTIESVRTNNTRPRSGPRKKPHKAEARPKRGRG